MLSPRALGLPCLSSHPLLVARRQIPSKYLLEILLTWTIFFPNILLALLLKKKKVYRGWIVKDGVKKWPSPGIPVCKYWK